MVKLVFCCRRLAHLSRAEFQSYWRETHGPLVRSHAALLRIRRYVQTHTLDSPVNATLAASRGAPEEFDGIAELWWDSLDDLTAATASSEGGGAAVGVAGDGGRVL